MGSIPVRLRLTVWYGSILAAALGLAGGLAWFAMRANLYAAIDADLRDRALAAAGDLEQELEQHGQDNLRTHLLERGSVDIWQIRASSGAWLYRTTAAAANETPLPMVSGEPSFSNITVGGSQFRAVAASARDRTRGTCTVQLIEPLDPVDNALTWFARTMALACPALLLAACAGGYWISGRALSPVDRITRTARAITATNLSRRIPLPESNDELRRLAETVNGMLDRLEVAFARMTQFTADASHELRTPVAVMRTTAEVLLRRSRSEAEWRQGVAEIGRESARMTELLDRMMTLARADSGAETCARLPVDVDDVVAAAARTGAALATAKGVELAVSRPEKTIKVLGDARLLERLLVILLDNAVKYTPPGGRVLVAIEPSIDRVVMVVRDTGIGIAPEDLPKIFERFYRSDKARSRDSGGSGLGLSIARWIVEMHHGGIDVDSRLGVGSEFRVTFRRDEL